MVAGEINLSNVHNYCHYNSQFQSALCLVNLADGILLYGTLKFELSIPEAVKLT